MRLLRVNFPVLQTAMPKSILLRNNIIIISGDVVLPNFVEAFELYAADYPISIFVTFWYFQIKDLKYLFGCLDI